MGNNVINSVGFISGFGPLIRGAKFINGFSGNTSGTVDIYTVPAGRKAFISWVYGISSPIMSGTLNIKVSGTYYNLLGANAAFGNVARLFVGQVINAGESFSFITGANPGGNLWVRIMEMDISTPLYTGRNLNLTSGANTLMTVSAGKTAMVIDSSGGCYINSSGGQYRNLSGSARSVQVYHVPNGGSPGSGNQFSGNAAVANNAAVTVSVPRSMNSGDSIVVNTDASTATQWAYTTYYEI